jgi:hypothetical protein
MPLLDLLAQVVDKVLRALLSEKLAGFVGHVSLLAKAFDLVALLFGHDRFVFAHRTLRYPR